MKILSNRGRLASAALSAAFFASVIACHAADESLEPETTGSRSFRGRPISDWVHELRSGPIEELDEAGRDALLVWKAAARDSKAVGWVRHAMQIHFSDQAWVGDVYAAMLDEPGSIHAMIALGFNPAACRQAAPKLMEKIRELAQAESEEEKLVIDFAMGALLSLEPAPKGSVELVRDLWPQSTDRSTLRWELMKLLGATGEEGVPVLIDLWLRDPQVENDLFRFLTRTNRGTLDGLIAASSDKETPRRRLAALMIDRVAGSPHLEEHQHMLVGPTLRLLQDSDPHVRGYAIAAIKDLSAQAGAEAAIPILGGFVRKEGKSPRIKAAQALAAFGDEALPEIRRAASSERADVRVAACSALANLDPFPKCELDLLLELAEDNEPHVRRYAAFALGETGLDDHTVVAALLRARDDPKTRDWATRALTALGHVAEDEVSKEAIAELRAELKNEDLTKRLQAASTLWSLTQDVDRVLPVARAIARDDEGISSGAYSVTYRTVDGKRVEDRHHFRYPLAARAIRLLGEMGPAAKPAVGDLARLLDHSNRYVSGGALRAIEKLGPVAIEAVPALRKKIEERDNWSRALDVLRRIDADAAADAERELGLRGSHNAE